MCKIMNKILVTILSLSLSTVFSQEIVGYELIDAVIADHHKNSQPTFNNNVVGAYVYLFEKLPELKKLDHSHLVRMNISDEGKVRYVIVYNGDSSCKSHRKDIEKCLLNMPLWTPATYDGKPIEVRFYEMEFS